MATVAAMTAAAGLVSAVPAQAAQVIRVRCPTDNLQTAIDSAPPGSTLLVFGTCTGNFTISKNLTLIGYGATLDGNNSGPVVTVTPGVQAQLTTLTITHGRGPGVGFGGGGIQNLFGTVTLDHSTVVDNTAPVEDGGGASSGGFGGGIANTAGTVTLHHSTVRDNTAQNSGGGIATGGGGTMVLDHSTVSGNSSQEGGGIFNDGDTVTLNGSAVHHNSATFDGGGIYNSAGTVTLVRSIVRNNTPNNCAPPGSVPGCTS
ncbi:hypothetical protein [Streptomyces puniciscabiei]|uniref:hypothetical protein n=1 Tax=Streptomyces puniciscabiei TaxID=164348 RepID=UPI003332F684